MSVRSFNNGVAIAEPPALGGIPGRWVYGGASRAGSKVTFVLASLSRLRLDSSGKQTFKERQIRLAPD